MNPGHIGKYAKQMNTILNILKDLEKGYPGKAHIFHTPTGLLYETFKQKDSKVTSTDC